MGMQLGLYAILDLALALALALAKANLMDPLF